MLFFAEIIMILYSGHPVLAQQWAKGGIAL